MLAGNSLNKINAPLGTKSKKPLLLSVDYFNVFQITKPLSQAQAQYKLKDLFAHSSL